MIKRDFRGRKVDHLITFDEFESNWLKYHIGNCHHFTRHGFLFDEVGAFGCYDTPVGFKTKEDCKLYRQWRKTNRRNMRLKSIK